MRIETLHTAVSALPPGDRRKLLAFMVALENQSRPGYPEDLARKIDDKSPERWLTVEECEHKLGLSYPSMSDAGLVLS